MVERSKTLEFKVAVLGAAGVGKSSLCLQFSRNRFPENYEPTVEDYYRKQMAVDGDAIMFYLIDTAGQDASVGNLNSLIQQAIGFIIVYDITNRQTLQDAKQMRDRILHVKDTSHIPLVLVGNKSDVENKREVTAETAKKLAEEWNCQSLEVSAKTRENLETAFIECARKVKEEINNRKGREGLQNCCLCRVF
ncbi:unnamed protein product [Blepharisma stoltei]|uniref:Uncharacterized protein n=1 Tax=Blepharisma stoltei TaxID=1481888 RepID=A0AAU9J303_9CILI|nr:unnamed protein product [Blepharisma stoltei]